MFIDDNDMMTVRIENDGHEKVDIKRVVGWKIIDQPSGESVLVVETNDHKENEIAHVVYPTPLMMLYMIEAGVFPQIRPRT